MLPNALAPTEPLAEMLRQCESLCQAGSFVVSGPDWLVQPSAGLLTLLGLPADSPAQALAALAWVPEPERKLLAHLWRHAQAGTVFDLRHTVLTADGRRLQVLHRGLLRHAATEPQGPSGFAVLHDVTAQREAEERLHALSHANETTGLPNRAWLLQKLDMAVNASGWDQRGFSVLSVEVPRIAELASSMGFGAADALAGALAARLRAFRSRDEFVAQMGSSEFALVIRHPSGLVRADIEARARALIDALQQPVRLGRVDVHPHCRVGVAAYPDDGPAGPRVLEAAQAARADAGTATPIAFHTLDADERNLRALALENELRQALEHGEFRLHYQPQVSLQGGEIYGVEALLRWFRADGSSVAPGDFLPVAERTGLVAAIGDWVIREASQQAVAWRRAGVPATRIAINLSPVQFQVGDVARSLRSALDDSGAQASDLGLELTESALLHDGDRVAATLGALQASGLEISLDDFGTGFSSLSRLRQLPIDVLKIDRSFVQDITTSAEAASVVRSIINLAHGLKVRVLAEGVETEAQLRLLASAGCDAIQGYFFSPPVDADTLATMLRTRRQLPAELAGSRTRSRTLLLVDDEENILSSLRRLFRRDGYKLLTATSGEQALALLATTEVDVIVSDQRMPGMAGVDFLRRAKELWPDTIRMTLSGFTDLQTIIDAVNEGAVFKFLTKPWDDDRLREHVAQAFRQKELADENRRLTQALARASIEQASLNRRMSSLLAQQREQAELVEAGAGGVRDLLELMPAAVLGIDPEGTLAYLNERASELFPQALGSLGQPPAAELATVLNQLRTAQATGLVTLGDQQWRGWLRHIDGAEFNRGDLLVLLPCCKDAA
ncbi:EAL domain-containing protein [Ideonella sp. 4Y11]|uniref:EAL domain-containing protein n=1 Tax=Ideonella aquatica TaxID=2824119 RepID=A0A940YEB5_9BURK|nr:EAL domain-containing protein [Ideonella aquatica]MBQ0958638.1 EAL domain-containing protein [Ideonella aquatica]